MNRYLFCFIIILSCSVISVFSNSSRLLAEEKVGVRPYEMDWAGRTTDDHEPLVDFESMGKWNLETRNMDATFEQSREEQLFGQYVAKLTYKATDSVAESQVKPMLWLRPEQPIPFPLDRFDTISCWIYGNNWGWTTDASTPRVSLFALFKLKDGSEIEIPLAYVNWKEWFLNYKRLSEEEIKLLQEQNGCFNGFRLQNGSNLEPRTLYFDHFAVFYDEMQPLTFSKRPKRGIDMFPGQPLGQNTGEGRLPFPNRKETILPKNVVSEFSNDLIRLDEKNVLNQKRTENNEFNEANDLQKNVVEFQDGVYEFSYQGTDGRLTLRYSPKTGSWSDFQAKWNDSAWFLPLAQGGVNQLIGENGQPEPVQNRKLIKTWIERLENEKSEEDSVSESNIESELKLVTQWQFSSESTTVEVEFHFQMIGKNLIIDSFISGGKVPALVFGRVENIVKPQNVLIPYYSYGYAVRPAALVFKIPQCDKALFALGNIDWYRSNASYLKGDYQTGKLDEKSEYGIFNGAAEYRPKMDGTRNDVFERFIVSISPTFSEVLPTIANPVSPWKHITGSRVWRSHGASDRQRDKDFWKKVWRLGMRNIVITDHETCWRDGGESFTFRTKPAPKKGGDDGWVDYSRYLQKELGFVYGPYNNFTDFAPVNEFWSSDMIARDSNGQLQPAWMRCYAPKPARAVEFCEKLTPINQAKFHFSTAYCDVHSSVTPWSRTDYDPRVPGAGTFAAVYYPYGEIMLIQKANWKGPVYSEGPHHCFYSGLTDGNYAQDQAYQFPNNPWLVDFDLLKIHDLECNFGMGNISMFAPQQKPSDGPNGKADFVDRFLAATIAFGHPGFFACDYGLDFGMLSYFMIQQIASRYTQVAVASIDYIDENGNFFKTSEAIAENIFRRNQLVVRYEDGTVVVVNGNKTEMLQTVVDDRAIELPPNGYLAWTKENDILVQSMLQQGKRFDYCESPEYIFLNGRGTYQQCPKACGAGLGVCRILENDEFEIIPFNQAELGFKIDVDSAVALDEEGNEIGMAQIKKSRGFVFVEPVENAFSYLLKKNSSVEKDQTLQESSSGQTLNEPLISDRFMVAAGEIIVVQNAASNEKYEIQIPEDSIVGAHLWFEPTPNCFIDFLVIPFGNVSFDLKNDRQLLVDFSSNIPSVRELTVQMNKKGNLNEKSLELSKEGKVIFVQELDPVEKEGIETIELLFRGEKESQPIQMTVNQEIESIFQYKSFDYDFGDQSNLSVPFSVSIQLRDQKPTGQIGGSAATFHFDLNLICGTESRSGYFSHPPYQNGVGRVFADFELTLPEEEELVFRTEVGKRNDSVSGDGILFQIAVLPSLTLADSLENDSTNESKTDETKVDQETVLGETVVVEHEWKPLEADLSSFAGQTIRLRLICDCGKADNPNGDWGCWSRLRLESPEKCFQRLFR
ncbi:MAG: hypothetical protein Q4C95_08510 [Planctomycetia bacterium]|nr:hypothetical protein [Planctomycetia bacterium]